MARTSHMDESKVVIQMKDIVKKFGDFTANDHINLTVHKGEVHAILGENGAGKSTMMNVLCGLYKPTSGQIFINEKEVHFNSPKDAIDIGIGMVHQHFMLIQPFTVTENIILGMEPTKGLTIDKETAKEKVMELSERYGMKVDPDAKVEDISVGMQQRVEILKVLYRGAETLILDEPTASLSDKETNLLFSIVRNLKAKGTSVLYVTHRLEEIMALTDRVTVLRNGELVSTCDTASTSQKELVRLMSGNGEADSKHMMPDSTCCSRSAATQSFPALTISHLSSADHIVKDASLTVHAGRITGMFGLCGSGRTEFLECIYGIRRISGGTIEISGEKVKKPTPVNSIKKGIAFICEDRRRKAMIPSFTVEENMNLSSIDHYSKKGIFSTTAAVSAAKGMINALKIRCTGTSQPACELSGGNQQKVVFAKALLTSPSIWLCDEPTQAVDVATRQQIHSLLHHQAAENKAVLYVSSDLTELLEVADEIAVMASGKIRKIFPNKNLKPADILACCYEAEREETHENESI